MCESVYLHVCIYDIICEQARKEASSSESAASDLNLGAPPPFKLGLTMYVVLASNLLSRPC